MYWTSHTEPPGSDIEEAAVALIMLHDEAGGVFYLRDGLACWKGGQFIDERTGEPLDQRPFWYCWELGIVREFERSPRTDQPIFGSPAYAQVDATGIWFGSGASE